MIVETAIICGTVIVIASLRAAIKLQPPPRLTKRAREEKRRILQGQRDLWATSYHSAKPDDPKGVAYWRQVERLDDELIKLAETDTVDDIDTKQET